MLKKNKVCPCMCARAKNLFSNVRFSLHVLRVFLNASLKNSGKLCLKGGLSLHVLAVYTPMNVFVCTCCEFFLTLR